MKLRIVAAGIILLAVIGCARKNDGETGGAQQLDAASALSIARTFEESGDFEEAATLYRYCIEQNPDDWQTRMKLADMYDDLELPGRVVELLEGRQPPAELQKAYFRKLARGLYETGDYAASAEAYRSLVNLHGVTTADRRFAMAGIAKCLRDSGDYTASLEIFRQVEADGADYWLYYDMGKLFEAMTNRERAREYYRKAMKERRENGGGYEGLAEDKLAASMFDSAMVGTNASERRTLLIEITNDPGLDTTRYGDRARYQLERL